MSASKKLHLSMKCYLQSQSSGAASFIKRTLKPMIVSERALFFKAERGAFLNMVCAGSNISRILHEECSNDSVDIIIVEELVALVASNASMKDRIINGVCDVAEASLHTTKPADRCIESTVELMKLVVGACQVYDDMEGGLGYMWRLIETTPTSDGVTSPASKSVDEVETALTAGEIMKNYFVDKPLPPFSVFLPKSSQHKSFEWVCPLLT